MKLITIVYSKSPNSRGFYDSTQAVWIVTTCVKMRSCNVTRSSTIIISLHSKQTLFCCLFILYRKQALRKFLQQIPIWAFKLHQPAIFLDSLNQTPAFLMFTIIWPEINKTLHVIYRSSPTILRSQFSNFSLSLYWTKHHSSMKVFASKFGVNRIRRIPQFFVGKRYKLPRFVVTPVYLYYPPISLTFLTTICSENSASLPLSLFKHRKSFMKLCNFLSEGLNPGTFFFFHSIIR